MTSTPDGTGVIIYGGYSKLVRVRSASLLCGDVPLCDVRRCVLVSVESEEGCGEGDHPL